MYQDLKQNLSGNYSSQSNLSFSPEPPEHESLENIYDYVENLETTKETSIKKGTNDWCSLILSVDEYQIVKSKIFKNVYCPKCAAVCSVLILETGYLIMDCKCTRILNISADEFINDYLHNDNNNDKISEVNGIIKLLSDLCCCPKHKKEKFIFYCTDCCKDICKKCLEEEYAKYSNTEKKNKLCENHTLITLDQNDEIFENIKDLLDKIEKNIDYRSDQKTIDNLFLIIRCFVDNYKNYQCYNSLISIQNFEKFLQGVYNSPDSKYKLKKREGSIIHLKKINSEKELLEKIHDFGLIYSINIVDTHKNIDLSKMNNMLFSNLKELILRGNKIKDISFLINNDFPNLEKIDIEENELGNDAIKILKKSKLPKLKFLNLFKTEITSIKIFDVVKNFKELQVFYIGENKFDMKEIERDESTFIFPEIS